MTILKTLQALPEERGLRLDVFLARRLDPFSRSHVQALNRSGAVRVEGRSEKSGYRMRGDETVEVEMRGLPQRPALQPKDIPLRVVYEDQDLAVVEKPAGLAVHPGAGTSETLVHGLLFRFGTLSAAGGEGRPGIVHRLDKWTSGLLLVARNDRAHVHLSRAFQERRVEKLYVALVHGKLRRPSGEINLSIGRHATMRTRMSAQPGRGREALSSYRVIEEMRGFSLVEVKIKTGRTHQIRVHLSAIGHPVVGDPVYGERRYAEFVKKYGKPGRYFLHAAELRFTHPRTGAVLTFQSPLPADCRTLLERIRGEPVILSNPQADG